MLGCGHFACAGATAAKTGASANTASTTTVPVPETVSTPVLRPPELGDHVTRGELCPTQTFDNVAAQHFTGILPGAQRPVGLGETTGGLFRYDRPTGDHGVAVNPSFGAHQGQLRGVGRSFYLL